MTRLKIVPNSAGADASRTEDEKMRGAYFAKRLSMAHLTRAWQMLLKGVSETSLASQPDKAAEMVIIRLAHAANLPSGDELMKQVQDAKPQIAPRPLPNLQPQSPTQQPVAEIRSTVQAMPRRADKDVESAAMPQTVMRSYNSFSDIVGLAAEKRDIKFKSDLERYIRPISVGDGKIDLALEQGAEPGLANELSRKLEQWTGRRWIVAVARSGGDATLAQQRKEAKDTAFKAAREHKDVQAVLKAFPGAEILNVTDVETPNPTEEADEESR